MSENILDKDPAADANMASMLRGVLDKYMKSVDGMLPATVVSYNRTTNRATVVPTINMVTTSGEALARAPYANLPVLALGGGEFFINFPLKAGDTGWIEASDRDISLWLQGAGAKAARPNTYRAHSFSDGRFIPDVLGNYTLADDADGAMVIQHKDGSTAVVISNEGVTIKAAQTVKIEAPNVEINAPQGIAITGPVTSSGGMTIDGITFGTHTHSGVQTGSGNTGGPQ